MWRCWFFHKWSKWQMAVTELVYGGDPVIYKRDMNKRTCERCGLVVRRLI